MLLRTQLLRGLFALPLMAAMLLAQALVPAPPADLGARLEAARRAATLAAELAECTGKAQAAVANWLLTSTPLDLPIQRRSVAPDCPRG